MATPGYRAKHSFAEVLGPDDNAMSVPGYASRTATNTGLLTATGNSHDLAISGEGYFELRGEGLPVYTRNGQFTLDADGRLLGLGGRALQGVGGGDIVLPDADAAILADGTVMDGEDVLGRIAVMAFDEMSAVADADGALRPLETTAEALEDGIVRQGYLEGSNVSLGDEMIAMMEAVRRAETGQRLMNAYDDLMGRVITTIGQAS